MCRLLALFALVYLCSAQYCGPWIPLDWQAVPKAQPTDVIEVYYLASPLMYCQFEDDADWINGYHGALGLLNTRTRKSWNLNYDAWPTFPGAIFPHVQKDGNGSVVLNWTNFGGVFIYDGMNETYFHTLHQLVATMNGEQFNSFIAFLPFMNHTNQFYNLFSVFRNFPSDPLFEGYNCFQWAFDGLAEIQRLGGTLVDGVTTLKQSLAILYSRSVPKKVDINDPQVFADIVEFYEALEAGWKDIGIVDFFEEIWSIAIEGRFYIYDNVDYYFVELSFPYLEVHWYPINVPIVPPNGTKYDHNGHDHNLIGADL